MNKLLTAFFAIFMFAPLAECASDGESKEGGETGEGATEVTAPLTTTVTYKGQTVSGVPVKFINKDGSVNLKAVLDWMDDMYRSKSSIAEMELTVVKPRRTRTMTMKSWSKGEERALIYITGPKRYAGTATLKVENNLWNYLPRSKRTMRLGPSMMMQSWNGSDFSNDDLVRESSLADDYNLTLKGLNETKTGWVIELSAKPDIVGLWNKIEYEVAIDASVPLGAKYYDRKDRLSRVMTFDQITQFGERKIPARMTLQPYTTKGEPEKDRRTIMTYIDIKFNAEVKDRMFSLSALERNR